MKLLSPVKRLGPIYAGKNWDYHYKGKNWDYPTTHSYLYRYLLVQIEARVDWESIIQFIHVQNI